MPVEAEFELPRVCVLTVQGGGAMGAELVGQLQGVTGRRKTLAGADTGDHEMNVAGIAGTSAGAIVATLFWAGYKPPDILRIVRETFAPGAIETFFGGYDAAKQRNYASVDGFLKRAGSIIFGPWRPARWPRFAPAARQGLARALLMFDIFYRHGWAFRDKGILPGDGVTNTIDRLLRESPYLGDDLRHVQGLLTFRHVRDLASLPMVPLFLMVTDVANQSLRIVSSIDSDISQGGPLDLPIAQAVRASAGFPVFFQPVPLGDSPCCADGGLISNLPTFVFSDVFRESLRQAKSSTPEEAARLRSLAALPWYHVSLRLGAAAPPGDPASGADYLLALWKLLSGVGRRQLENTLTDFVAKKRFIVEPGPGQQATANPVGSVLNFARLADRQAVERDYDVNRRLAQASILPQRFAIPSRTRVLPLLVDLVAKASAALRPSLAPGSRIRSNVYLPRTSERLSIAYAVNMDGATDEGLDLAQGGSVTGLCYLYREPFLANLRDQRLDKAVPPRFHPFEPKAHPDRTWMISVPILDTLDLRPRLPEAAGRLVMDVDGPIYGVLNIDANLLFSEVSGTGAGSIDPDPAIQAGDAVIRLVFDAMRITARQIGLLINEPWL